MCVSSVSLAPAGRAGCFYAAAAAVVQCVTNVVLGWLVRLVVLKFVVVLEFETWSVSNLTVLPVSLVLVCSLVVKSINRHHISNSSCHLMLNDPRRLHVVTAFVQKGELNIKIFSLSLRHFQTLQFIHVHFIRACVGYIVWLSGIHFFLEICVILIRASLYFIT